MTRREVLPTAVVRATMVATLASDLFPGLTQQVVVSLYNNGEVRLENTVTSRGYADLTKLEFAEVLVAPPEVPEDFVERLKSEQWQLEGEWRMGYFRWMPAEMVAIRDNHGIPYPEDLNLDMAEGDWPLHMIPGDQYGHRFYYVPYTAPTLAEAVKYLEARYGELTGVRLP